MTFRFNVNNTYDTNTGNRTIYNFKEFMKLTSPSGPGWSVVKSGDGVAATSSTGDIITSSGSGANGMDNTNAWFVLRAPDGQREFLWQRGSSSGSWLILYSAVSKFTGGNATTRASATDAGVIVGTTSDPSTAAGANHLINSSNGVIVHYGADDADGYAFYYTGYLQTTLSTAYGGMVFDELQDGTFQDGYEEDPYIIYIACGGSGNNWSVLAISSETETATTTRCLGYMYKDTIYQTFGSIQGVGYVADVGTGTPDSIPPYGGINLYSLKAQILPIFYIRMDALSGGTGFKGAGKYMKFKSANRGTGQTMSLSSKNDMIIVNDVVLPFNGAEPLM